MSVHLQNWRGRNLARWESFKNLRTATRFIKKKFIRQLIINRFKWKGLVGFIYGFIKRLMMILSTVDKAYHNKMRFKPKIFQSLRQTYIVIESSCLYCVILLMEEILHHLGCIKPCDNRINYLSSGAGFLLSTVHLDQ